MNTKELLERYATSWFDSFVPAERVLPKNARKAAEAEYDRDPVRCLMENVEEAREAVQGTADRIRRAKQEGLFDADWYKAADKEDKRKWEACISVVRGDYERARVELAHWRECVQWATDEQRAKVARLEGDPRLPPEREEEVA